MIANAKEWATQRGLVRRNEVHKAEEYKIPTQSTFMFRDLNQYATEQSGSMEMDDPDGTLLDSSDFTEEAATLILVCTLGSTIY